MRYLLPLAICMVAIACNQKITPANESSREIAPHDTCTCLPGWEALDFVTVFQQDKSRFPTPFFDSVVHFIGTKGFFKPIDKNGAPASVSQETEVDFPVYYDTCEGTRRINKNFLLRNMKMAGVTFHGNHIGMGFEEWKFDNNLDRDSAMRIIRTAMAYPGNEFMYEKQYREYILAEKRVLLVETGAAHSADYPIKYRALIEKFVAAYKGPMD
ncbi:MAG: hypothetical protein EOO09_19455 [Chitinophagaceae bacterium]|nr:MAG: hypothetical protein EOO09_19455 [Chitinophagaceae bacterium]